MRKDILSSYPNLDPAKVEVIYNGIDSAKWAPTQNQDVLDRYGIDSTRRTVMFVGRITRQKGLSYFLQAARNLPEDVQLILAAGAPDTKEIQTEVEALVSELSANRSGVTWIPEHLPQKELAALLTQTDLFVCPSIYEPLGIVNLEAMACGAAVIGTATGGIPEVIVDGQTGWLVEIDQVSDGTGTPKDPDKFIHDWSEGMLGALDSGQLQAFGEAGRQRAISEFSWESIATRTLELYQRALES
jgi:starch synthase